MKELSIKAKAEAYNKAFKIAQEDKKLLFNDLCARLPYHVKCKIWLEDGTTDEWL